jgi:hypothetical protein
MQKFYFHLSDGHQMRDLVGTDFPSLDAARLEAVRIAGEWLRDNADTVAERRALRFDVSDANRKILTSIAVSVMDPATSMI